MRRALSSSTGKISSGGDPDAAQQLAAALHAAVVDVARRDVHAFHSYPARLHPATCARLLAPVKPGSLVLDPFCGSGTTLIEANRRGLAARGSDANPLAVRLAALKTTFRQPEECKALVSAAAAISEASADRAQRRVRTRSSGEKYDDPKHYEPHVFRELVGLREEIDGIRSGALKEALLLVLSSIVVKFSRYAGDTANSDEKPDSDETGRQSSRQIGRGIPSRFFHRKAEELSRALATFSRLRGSRDVEVRIADARRLSHLANGSIDCVVTSPPYFGTYDYVEHHQRRYGWLGIDPAPFERKEIGARRHPSQKEWSDAVTAYAKELGRVTKVGGPILVVTGDSTVGGKHIPGDQMLRQVAPNLGLRIVAWASEERPQFARDSSRRQRLEHALLIKHA